MKAILVVDMPMSCEECICADVCTDHVYCQADSYKIGSTKERPTFCPLKPIPNRIEICGKWISEEYQKGWNACLEVIERK